MKSNYINRRHRRASKRYTLALHFGKFDAGRSAAAGYYMTNSIDRLRRRQHQTVKDSQ